MFPADEWPAWAMIGGVLAGYWVSLVREWRATRRDTRAGQ